MSWSLRRRFRRGIQKRQALVLPAKISETHGQRERDQDQNHFPSAAAFRLVIFEEVIEIARTRRRIWIDTQARPLLRCRRLIQSQKRRPIDDRLIFGDALRCAGCGLRRIGTRRGCCRRWRRLRDCRTRSSYRRSWRGLRCGRTWSCSSGRRSRGLRRGCNRRPDRNGDRLSRRGHGRSGPLQQRRSAHPAKAVRLGILIAALRTAQNSSSAFPLFQ